MRVEGGITYTVRCGTLSSTLIIILLSLKQNLGKGGFRLAIRHYETWERPIRLQKYTQRCVTVSAPLPL